VKDEKVEDEQAGQEYRMVPPAAAERANGVQPPTWLAQADPADHRAGHTPCGI
jgi:hypothetical protein